MLRIAITIMLLSCIAFTGSGQTFEARYKVVKDIFSSDNKGGQKLLASLDLEGFLYQKNGRYISFKKPLYLEKYPLGRIDIKISDNNISSISLYMDSLQTISYIDTDSLVLRNRNDNSGTGNTHFNFFRKFEPGIQQWNLSADSKEMNGLKCQKAQLFSAAGTLVYEAWFCPDIPMGAGPMNTCDLPGLIVEMKCLPFNEYWVLEKYTRGAVFDDSVFWPAEFNQPFKEQRPVKRPDKAEEPSKKEKRMDILNQ